MASGEKLSETAKKDSVVNSRPPEVKIMIDDCFQDKKPTNNNSEMCPDSGGGSAAAVSSETVPPDQQKEDSHSRPGKRQRAQRKADKTRQRLDKAGTISRIQFPQDLEVENEYTEWLPSSHRSRFSRQHCNTYAWNHSTINPDRQYPLYIKRIDEVLALDESIQKLNKKALDLYDSLCREFRRDSPPADLGYIQRQALFDCCIDAYKNIKNRLLNKDENHNCLHQERLLAALEATGQIILTPHLIKRLDGHTRNENPSVKTSFFTSPKTSEILEKMTWDRQSGSIIFHFIERTNLHFGGH